MDRARSGGTDSEHEADDYSPAGVGGLAQGPELARRGCRCAGGAVLLTSRIADSGPNFEGEGSESD